VIAGTVWSAIFACSQSCVQQLRLHYHGTLPSIPGWVLAAAALAGAIGSILGYIRLGRHRTDRLDASNVSGASFVLRSGRDVKEITDV
jgi:hypothetical protein